MTIGIAVHVSVTLSGHWACSEGRTSCVQVEEFKEDHLSALNVKLDRAQDVVHQQLVRFLLISWVPLSPC